MNRPGMDCHRLQAGDWLAHLYIADVSGGVCTVLCDHNATWTREEIEAEGERIRREHRRVKTRRQRWKKRKADERE